MEACRRELGLETHEELNALINGELSKEGCDPEIIERARAAKYRFMSRRVRGILLTFCFRSFMFAATDLYRLRVTSALGACRSTQPEEDFVL